MVEQENQQVQPMVVLQVSMTDEDFGNFILRKPFNPQILAIASESLNEVELAQFQEHLSGALNVLLSARLRDISDKINGIVDTEFTESEE